MKKKGKRIIKITALSLAGVIIVTVIAAGFILYGRIASMLSIKHIGDDLYTMNYQQDYHLDKALSAGIKNEEDLLRFVCDDMFFGYQVDGNLSKYGCSAFLTPTPNGEYLVGRSFGLGGSDTLCVYTHPKDGYASVSTVSTDMISVGEGSEFATTSFLGRAVLLAAPYMGVDGLNEKGLTASLLDMDDGETHMSTDNPDVTVTMVIRMLLDRAATVNEAIELLEKYDIHTGHGWTQHIFIADANGDAAVAEWYNDKMKVVNYNVCTNFRMSNQSLNGDYSGQCDRFDLLDDALIEKPENTAEDSMKLLEAVKQDEPGYNIFTEWSVVFNLSDFSADYVVNMDFERVYHLNSKDF